MGFNKKSGPHARPNDNDRRPLAPRPCASAAGPRRRFASVRRTPRARVRRAGKVASRRGGRTQGPDRPESTGPTAPRTNRANSARRLGAPYDRLADGGRFRVSTARSGPVRVTLDSAPERVRLNAPRTDVAPRGPCATGRESARHDARARHRSWRHRRWRGDRLRNFGLRRTLRHRCERHDRDGNRDRDGDRNRDARDRDRAWHRAARARGHRLRNGTAKKRLPAPEHRARRRWQTTPSHRTDCDPIVPPAREPVCGAWDFASCENVLRRRDS